LNQTHKSFFPRLAEAAGEFIGRVSASSRQKNEKAVAVSGAYGGFFTNPVGGDIFRKDRAPTPLDLIRENMGTANACVRLNSQGVARVPLRLFVTTKKGQSAPSMSLRGQTKKLDAKTVHHLKRSPQTGVRLRGSENVEEVTDHPLLDLLRSPGGMGENALGMGQFGLFELTQSYLEVIGNAFWYIEKNGMGGTPSAIWPLPSQFVQQIPGSTSDRLIDKYILAIGGSKTEYDPSEIVAFRMMDVYNPYLGGFSPLRAGIEAQKVMRMALALTNSRMQNGGRPSAVWSPSDGGDSGGMIDPEGSARMRNAFRQAFSQAGAGGIAVAPFAGSIQTLTWPMNDIIDAARYELTQSQICAAFSVPVTKVSRKDANRASAESGDYAHAVDAVLPRCAANADVINRFLIPMFDTSDRMFVAYDNPTTDDATFILDQTRAGSQLGLQRVDEGRAAIGLDPLPDGTGQVRLVPANMIPVGDDGSIDAAYVASMAAMKPAPQNSTAENSQNASNQPKKPAKDAKIRKRLAAAGYCEDEIVGMMDARL
jgi:hypothetical protein